MNTLYYGDNRDILPRYVKDESVELIYLDPPFKSNQDYNVLFAEQSGEKSAAQIMAFEDTWHWDMTAQAWFEQIESKLKNGKLEPKEYEFKLNNPVQWLIHRYDSEPADEIFEIEELELYELLPAGHTTIVAFLPEKKGKFKIVLGAEREGGVVRVS